MRWPPIQTWGSRPQVWSPSQTGGGRPTSEHGEKHENSVNMDTIFQVISAWDCPGQGKENLGNLYMANNLEKWIPNPLFRFKWLRINMNKFQFYRDIFKKWHLCELPQKGYGTGRDWNGSKNLIYLRKLSFYKLLF